jgi:hypothetical protein
MWPETTSALVVVIFDQVCHPLGNRSNPHLPHGCRRYQKPGTLEAQGMDMDRHIPHVQVGHGAQDF